MIIHQIIREACKLKNVTKSAKSPKGGGDQRQKSKSPNLKCGLFDKREGPNIFIFPQNVNANFKCIS